MGESEESRLIFRFWLWRIGCHMVVPFIELRGLKGCFFFKGGDYLKFGHMDIEVSVENEVLGL